LSDFDETQIFSPDFEKILQHQISRKSVQWEQSSSTRTDRHDDANSRFSEFWKRALKKKGNAIETRLFLYFHSSVFEKTLGKHTKKITSAVWVRPTGTL